MTLTVELLLLLLAAICFVLAAANTQSARVGLVPLGLFFWVLCDLLPLLG